MSAAVVRNYHNHIILFVLGAPVVLRILHQSGFNPDVPRAVEVDEVFSFTFAGALHSDRPVSWNNDNLERVDRLDV